LGCGTAWRCGRQGRLKHKGHKVHKEKPLGVAFVLFVCLCGAKNFCFFAEISLHRKSVGFFNPWEKLAMFVKVFGSQNFKAITMKVPFLDLQAQYQTIREEIAQAMQRVLDDAAFAGGPYVAQFEKDFALFCRCQYAIGVSNGTAALWLALRGLDIGPGDEVITVPNTFIATAEAISMCGATPVFVDLDESTYTMNPARLEAAITSRTKAVIPVHLYGQMADMASIMVIARAHGLFVIEDACQAHGATYKGRPAGSIGDAGCFSFYPGKNLGAYGEAGAIVTNNVELATKIKLLRDHGQLKKYYHTIIAWNARMDGLQGAILSVKLKHLAAWNNARRSHAQIYRALMAGLENVILPREAIDAKHVYHIYAIRVQHRDRMMKALAEKGIQCGVHYPIPLHLQEAYHFLGLPKGSFPIAEQCAEELLSLPMFPELTEEQIEYVARNVTQSTRLERLPKNNDRFVNRKDFRAASRPALAYCLTV
jgi:dTDP-4-amino-4,6-dideoxygalactose transaminase